MATNDDEVRKGHEHYLRHLLLLGQAAPVCLIALVKREIEKGTKPLENALTDVKSTFEILFNKQYQDLFHDDSSVDTNIDSWDTKLLCIVISLLFAHDLPKTEIKSLKCINDQINDFDDHEVTASMDYTAFKHKWDQLHESILQLLANADGQTQFRCKRLIHSFKSESVEVNSTLIEHMKETRDLKLHVRMAIKERVVPKVHHGVSNMDDFDGETSVEIRHHLDDTEVFENTDTVLTCRVNKLVDTPIWFHNDNQIAQSVRFGVSSDGLEHSLAIHNVGISDEGKYTVLFGDLKSTATLKIKVHSNLSHRYQMKQELYRNWVRGALGLKYLKQGIEAASRRIVNKQHSLMLNSLSTHTVVTCSYCTPENLLPYHADKTSQSQCPSRDRRKCLCTHHPKQLKKRSLCPNSSFCSQFYDLIIKEHRFSDPVLSNTEISNWSKEAWSVATCFINTPGYSNRKSEKEIDCSGLLSLIINDIFFEKELGCVGIDGKTDVFKQARDARNNILHNPRYELTEGELKAYIKLFKNVLEVENVTNKKALEHETGVPEALQNLDMLCRNQIDISISNDIEAGVKTLRENAMNDIADILEKSNKQTKRKLQQLQERLREANDELRLLRELQLQMQEQTEKELDKTPEIEQLEKQTTGIVIAETQSKEPEYLDVSIDIICESHETTASVKYTTVQTIKEFICNQEKHDVINKSETDTSLKLKTFLRQISAMSGVEIFNVLQDDDDRVIISIKCCTRDSIKTLIQFFNGYQLQESLFRFRTCLETEFKESCDVDAHITKTSVDKVKMGLCDRAVIEDISTVTCERHAELENDWYCPDHEEFCCILCKDEKHSRCMNIRGLSGAVKEEAIEEFICVKDEKGVNFSKSGSFSKSPIVGCCVLPNGEILITDMEYLTKLDSSLLEICHYDYRTSQAKDVCYVGKGLAAVSLHKMLRFLRIEGKAIETEGEMDLCHECNGLACSGTGNLVYFNDNKCVYIVNTKDAHEEMFYTAKCENSCIYKVVVSDSGERIFVLNGYGSIVTLDRQGSHLATLQSKEIAIPRYACGLANGTLVVCDYHLNTLVHIDSEGKVILGTVADESNGIKMPICACYDRKYKRIIVGLEEFSGQMLTFSLK